MKTLNQVIDELMELKDSGAGDLPVYVYADHGQTFIQLGGASVEVFEEYSYYAEGVHPDDVDEDEEAEYVNAVVIGD